MRGCPHECVDAVGAWGLRDGVHTWFSNLPMPSFFICSMRCRFCCWIHGVWDGAVEVSDGRQNLSCWIRCWIRCRGAVDGRVDGCRRTLWSSSMTAAVPTHVHCQTRAWGLFARGALPRSRRVSPCGRQFPTNSGENIEERRLELALFSRRRRRTPPRAFPTPEAPLQNGRHRLGARPAVRARRRRIQIGTRPAPRDAHDDPVGSPGPMLRPDAHRADVHPPRRARAPHPGQRRRAPTRGQELPRLPRALPRPPRPRPRRQPPGRRATVLRKQAHLHARHRARPTHVRPGRQAVQHGRAHVRRVTDGHHEDHHRRLRAVDRGDPAGCVRGARGRVPVLGTRRRDEKNQTSNRSNREVARRVAREDQGSAHRTFRVRVRAGRTGRG